MKQSTLTDKRIFLMLSSQSDMECDSFVPLLGNPPCPGTLILCLVTKMDGL